MKKLTVHITKKELIAGSIYMAFQILFLGLILVLGNQLLGQPLSEAEVQVLYFAINFICTWLIFHRYLIASARIALSAPWKCIKAALQGFGLYWLMSIVVFYLILRLRPDFNNVNDANISEIARENFWLMSIGTVVLVPVTEEVLFRGLLFRGIHSHSPILAYIVSVFFFAVMHVVSYIGLYDWGLLALCFLQYLPACIALAWAYEKADSIWASILIHTFVNLISMLALR